MGKPKINNNNPSKMHHWQYICLDILPIWFIYNRDLWLLFTRKERKWLPKRAEFGWFEHNYMYMASDHIEKVTAGYLYYKLICPQSFTNS